MKSKRTPTADIAQVEFGLVANGIAGAWEVSLDETLAGAQRWFVQIEGPGRYVNFQVRHPRIFDDMVSFLKWHMCHDGCAQRSGSSVDPGIRLDVSQFGGLAVSLIWDGEEAQKRCVILIKGKSQFVVRISIEHGDLVDLIAALEQVRDELSDEGTLT